MNRIDKAVVAAVGAAYTAFQLANVDHHLTGNEGLVILAAFIGVGTLTWGTPNAPAKVESTVDSSSPVVVSEKISD